MMYELAGLLEVLGRVGILLGCLGLGFGLLLKGISINAASPVLRFGAYTAAGSLIVLIAASLVQ